MIVIKRIAAVLCAVAIIVSGIAVAPTEAKAADAGIYTEITYESGYDISKYWTTDTKTVPTKPGYVFGGWHTKSDDTYIALEQTDIETDADGKASVSETVYAKFVPAQLLSVKAQNASGTEENDGKSAVRVISAVDSTDYQKVGFTVLINNKNKLTTQTGGELESATVFKNLKVEDEPYSAEAIFGKPAAYLNVWGLGNIPDTSDAKIINVTPYWITLDGTKVEGLSKYIHIEDGYKGYISVPVSLPTPQDVAAGTVTITYPEGLTLVEDKVEFADVFPQSEATYSVDKDNNTIKIVGNAETVGSYGTSTPGKTILVNLRFTSDTYPGAGKGEFLDFTVENEIFYNWEENAVEIDVRNVRY